MAKKMVASKRAGAKKARTKATAAQKGKAKGSAATTAQSRQLGELRRENDKLHKQIARYEVSNFSLKNRVAALEEILQDYGHIENPRLKRIIEEVQQRTRGAGDLLSNGPF